MKKEGGITLIALIVTIILLLILATVSINLIWNDNGILDRAKTGAEEYKKASIEEKIKLILGDYMIESAIGTKTIEEYLNEQKEKGEIEEVTNNGDGTITIEVDGYEVIIKEDDLSIVSTEKTGGVRPKFEVKATKTDGATLTGDETEKAITINITNIEEYGDNYTIEVKDKDGNIITKETSIISGITGQASYIINKSGSYTITVTGTKDGITKNNTKTEIIRVAMVQIEETVAFSRANGVIDIVWLDMNNNVISKPISPANYLGGLTAIKYNGETEVIVSDPKNDNSWYNYVAQTGVNDGKTSNWANARTGNSNAYFVWIPRYAYKITYFDTQENANAYRANRNIKIGIIGYSNNEGMIDVASGTEKLVTGTEPINVTEIVKTVGYSDYIPHPAFEFDGAKAGIWVGKFETSGSTSEVKIIPNTSNLANISVNEMYTACEKVNEIYNLTSDSHMMKNVEWGAVAYLTESNYGRNGLEIESNLNAYITGGGNYKSNVLQSTTGNIYGIYDISGPSWEYVTGYIGMTNYTTKLSTVDKKYVDIYTTSSGTNMYKKMKGDAIYETENWNKDYGIYPDSIEPIFLRGR